MKHALSLVKPICLHFSRRDLLSNLIQPTSTSHWVSLRILADRTHHAGDADRSCGDFAHAIASRQSEADI